jgi:antibiotic biosynthesis monooxygenase (ABM) superfamily enzyme
MAYVTDEPLEAQQGVTVVFVRRVKPGREADYEAWLPRIVAALRSSPGFRGVENLRPVKGLQMEHVLILRFDAEANLRGWEASPERKRLLDESRDFTEHVASIQRIRGLEGWFTTPGTRVSLAPPKWKMFLVVSLGLYPLVVLTATLIVPLLISVPLLPRLVVTTLLDVALMTWAVMPALTWALRDWLTPAPASAPT